MPTNKKGYMVQYQKERIKRIALDYQKQDYPPIKAAADASGMSVSGFIKAAVREKMEREGLQ